MELINDQPEEYEGVGILRCDACEIVINYSNLKPTEWYHCKECMEDYCMECAKKRSEEKAG